MADQIMAENKPQKPGLLRRILWWLWVILLTALLALGVFFAAPWKAITLIAIFLAAATILPRIYRKWFWLGVGIVIIALVVWVFLPEDNKDWKTYTFDKELAQLQARYAVPDSENAAIAYNKIFEDWKQKEANEPNLPDHLFNLMRSGPWLSKNQPEIAAYIQYYNNIIEGVLRATRIEKCSFPIVANAFDYGNNLGLLPATRQWAYLLVAAGNNDIAEGITNEALEKYFAVIRMGQHFSRQPNAVNMLVGIACEAMGLGGINNFVVLGDANELYLNKVEQAVSSIRHSWSSDLPGFIDSDKLMLKNMMGLIFYESNSKGRVRFSHDPTAKIREQIPKDLTNDTNDFSDFFSGYWFKKFMKAHTILYWFYVPTTPEELGRIIDASYDKNYTMTKHDFDWSKESEMPPEFHYKINIQQLIELMAKINKGVYPGLHDDYLRNSAKQRGTLLIIALRRYKNANGHWPEKLEDIKNSVPPEVLIDPMNNNSFVYKQIDDGFTLYGKGKNGVDEDGKYEYNWPAKPGADDLLIWPPKLSKDKKENDDVKQ